MGIKIFLAREDLNISVDVIVRYDSRSNGFKENGLLPINHMNLFQTFFLEVVAFVTEPEV